MRDTAVSERKVLDPDGFQTYLGARWRGWRTLSQARATSPGQTQHARVHHPPDSENTTFGRPDRRLQTRHLIDRHPSSIFSRIYRTPHLPAPQRKRVNNTIQELALARCTESQLATIWLGWRKFPKSRAFET